MQTLQSLFTKYWIFVVSIYSRLPYVIHFLSLVSYLLELMELLKFDLGPLVLISILFINIAIVT